MSWVIADPAKQPARQTAYQTARAQTHPVEPGPLVSGARLPGPGQGRAIAARSAEPLPERAPEIASGTPGSDGDDIAVTRELLRASLAQDIPRKLPELELSDGQLDQLTDAALRAREHQIRLRGLAHTRDNAAEIRRLEERLVDDLLVFEEVTGMPAAELTSALSDEGLTTEEQSDAEKPVYWTLPE